MELLIARLVRAAHLGLPLAVALAVAGAEPAAAGPVILGGDDLTDHGSFSGSANQLGWLYIEKAIASLDAAATRPGSVGIAALGAAASGSTSGDAGAAIGSAAAALGLPVTYYDGAASLSTFFSDLASANVNPRILWIAGNDSVNDLDGAEGAVLTANAAAINDFVGSGGGLMSHGYGPSVYGWLSALLPGAIETAVCWNPVSLTPQGSAAFPGLTNADVDAGPCHSTFSGDLGGLNVLAIDSADRAVIIGGADVTIAGACDGAVVEIDYQDLEHQDSVVATGSNYAEDGFRTVTSFGIQFSTYGTQHPFYSGSTAVFCSGDVDLTRDNVNLYAELTPQVARTPFDLLSVTLTELTDPSAGSMQFTGLQVGGSSSSLGHTMDGVFGPDAEIFFPSTFDRTVQLAMSGGQQIDDIRICEPRCEPSRDGMVAWWAADDCGAADSVSINHGTLVGGSTCGGPVPLFGFRRRMVGSGSLAFASGDHVEVPNPTGFVRDLSQGDFTVDAWMLIPAAFSDVRPVIERGGDPGYKLGVGTLGGQNSLVLEVRNGAVSYFLVGTTTVPLFDTYWHHVAVSYSEDPPGATFYVDGQAIPGLFLLLSPTLGNADQLLIGRDQASVSFEGWIDELQLYRRALDAAEIQAIYDAGTSGVCGIDDVIVIDGEDLTASGAFDITIGPSGKSLSGSVHLQFATSSGDSPEDVAANLAAAINADSTLQSEGVFAVVSGRRVDVGRGAILGASATDPDLVFELGVPENQEPPPVPLLAPGGGACLALLLTTLALLVRRSRQVG